MQPELLIASASRLTAAAAVKSPPQTPLAFASFIKIFILVGCVLLVNLSDFLLGPSFDSSNELASDRISTSSGGGNGFKFILPVAAGSKSKSKSSKTTVIAISGGGGAKPHPMPVPWPVVHCHHHHHHLKYVPKPVLIHHWVKKHKLSEYHGTASNENYQILDGASGGAASGSTLDRVQHAPLTSATNQLAAGPGQQQQLYQDFPEALLNSNRNYLKPALQPAVLPAPSSNFAYNLFDNDPTRNQLQFDLIDEPHPILDSSPSLLDRPNSSAVAAAATDQRAQAPNGRRQTPGGKKMDSSSSTISQKSSRYEQPKFSDKQLDKLTRTILTAQQKVGSTGGGVRSNKSVSLLDAEPIGSLNDNVVALDNSTTVLTEDTSKDFINNHQHHGSSESLRKSKLAKGPKRFTSSSKPNHPFDELHDQLKDETAPLETSSNFGPMSLRARSSGGVNLRTGLDQLARANQQEELASLKAFERLSMDSIQRLAAMDEHNRQLALMGGNSAIQTRQPVRVHPMQSNLSPDFQASALAPVAVQRNANLAARMASQMNSHMPHHQLAGFGHFNPMATLHRELSDSQAINLMTRLAGRMAQMEAHKLVERQLKSLVSNATKSANNSSASPPPPPAPARGFASLFGSFNVFSRLANGLNSSGAASSATSFLKSPLLNSDKRRESTTSDASQKLQTITNSFQMKSGGSTGAQTSPSYRRFLTWQSTTSSPSTPIGTSAASEQQQLSAPVGQMITASRMNPNQLMMANGSNQQKFVTRNRPAIGPRPNNKLSLQQMAAVANGTGSQQMEKLMIESSAQVSNIVEPSQQQQPHAKLRWLQPQMGFGVDSQTSKKYGQGPRIGSEISRQSSSAADTTAIGTISQAASDRQQSAPTTIIAIPPTPPTETATQPTSSMSSMSSDQANMFYVGQQEHLLSTTPGPKLAQTMVGSAAVGGPQHEPVYARQSSDVRQSIVLPSPQMGDQSEMAPPLTLGSEYQQVIQQHQLFQPQQQQQQLFARFPPMANEQFATAAPADTQLQADSMLQFPMSPEQWSSEAMRALNSDQQLQQTTDVQQQQQQGDQEVGADSGQDQQQQVDPSSGPIEQNNLANNNNEQAQNELMQLELMSAAINSAGGLSNDGALRAALAAAASSQPHQSLPFDEMALQQQQQQRMQMMMLAQQQQQQPQEFQAQNGFQHQQATSPYGYYTSGQPFHQNQHLMNALFPSAGMIDLSVQQQLQQSLAGSEHGSSSQASEIYSSQQQLPQESNFQPESSFAPQFTQWPTYAENAQEQHQNEPPPKKMQSMATAASKAQQKTMSGSKGQKFTMNELADLPPGGPNSLVAASLASPINELQQLRQFQASLNAGTGLNNGLSNQLRANNAGTGLVGNQQNFGRQAPQMPQIPNIPQPPQAPNIPMPPPGMMQMAASVALPLAMARMTRAQNRFRNQQVNAAATGGGSTPTTVGQRFLRGASNLTSRLMRPRRRPTSSPALASAASVVAATRPSSRRPLLVQASSAMSDRFRQPLRTSSTSAPSRRRPQPAPMAVRFIQTVIDMSRKPAAAGRPVIVLGNLAAGAASSALSVATKAAAASQSPATAVVSNTANAVRLAAASTVLSAAGAATAPAADKLKPKSDESTIRSNVLGRLRPGRRLNGNVVRLARTVSNNVGGGGGGEYDQQQQVILPGLPPIALTDGSLHRFDSMTSPVDLLHRQLRQERVQQHQLQQQQLAQLSLQMNHQNGEQSEGSITNGVTQTEPDYAAINQQLSPFELLRLSDSTTLRPLGGSSSTAANLEQLPISLDNFQLASGPYLGQHTQNHQLHLQAASQQQSVASNKSQLNPPVPVVANHFNLVMFTAQNVTGNLLKLKPDGGDRAKTDEAQVSDVQQQSSEPDPNAAQQQQAEQHQHQQQGASAGEQAQFQLVMDGNGQRETERRPQGMANDQSHNVMLIKMTQDDNSQQVNHQSEAPASDRIRVDTNANENAIASDSTAWEPQQTLAKTATTAKVKKTNLKRVKKIAAVGSSAISSTSPTTTPTPTSEAPETSTLQSLTTTMPPADSAIAIKSANVAGHFVASSSKWNHVASQSGDRVHQKLIRRSTSSRPKNSKPRSAQRQLGESAADANEWPSLSDQNDLGPANSPELDRRPDTTTSEQTSSEAVTQLSELKLVTLRPMTMDEQDTKAPNQTADYVRAIKLIRGVSYPWPPPTQSSKPSP